MSRPSFPVLTFEPLDVQSTVNSLTICPNNYDVHKNVISSILRFVQCVLNLDICVLYLRSVAVKERVELYFKSPSGSL